MLISVISSILLDIEFEVAELPSSTPSEISWTFCNRDTFMHSTVGALTVEEGGVHMVAFSHNKLMLVWYIRDVSPFELFRAGNLEPILAVSIVVRPADRGLIGLYGVFGMN